MESWFPLLSSPLNLLYFFSPPQKPPPQNKPTDRSPVVSRGLPPSNHPGTPLLVYVLFRAPNNLIYQFSDAGFRLALGRRALRSSRLDVRLPLSAMVCMIWSLRAGRRWWSGARKPGRMTFRVGGRAEGVAWRGAGRGGGGAGRLRGGGGANFRDEV